MGPLGQISGIMLANPKSDKHEPRKRSEIMVRVMVQDAGDSRQPAGLGIVSSAVLLTLPAPERSAVTIILHMAFTIVSQGAVERTRCQEKVGRRSRPNTTWNMSSRLLMLQFVSEGHWQVQQHVPIENRLRYQSGNSSNALQEFHWYKTKEVPLVSAHGGPKD